jgi:predicted TIM-barrel fold metal-dependent hydrolase
MKYVDAHHHFWDTAAVRYERLDSIPQLNGRFLAEQLASTAPSGIAGAVCVEAASAGADGKFETEWLLRTIATTRITTRFVAWAPIETPSARDHIAWLREIAGPVLAGIRRGFEHGEATLVCSKAVTQALPPATPD